MFIRPLLATTAIAMFLSAGVASAITPEEVWSLWKAQTEQAGATLTSSAEARNGDVLEISNAVATQSTPDAVVSVALEKIRLKDRGDGSVEVTLPDSFPLTVTATGDTAPFLSVALSQPGGSLIASGSADALNFAFSYPTTIATLTQLDAGDDDADKPEVAGSLTIANLAGKYLLTAQSDGKRAFDYAYGLDGMTLALTGTNATSGESFKAGAELGAASAEAKGVMMPLAKFEDLAAALRGGFAVVGTAKTGALTASFELTQPEGTSSGSLAFSATDLSTQIDQDRIAYGVGVKDLKLAATAPATGMPPADAGLSEFALQVALPVAKADEAGDFLFLTRLVDLTVSESVWGLVDPMAQLARDPATLIVDLKGKGAWNVDMLAPPTDMVEMPDMPVRVETLDVSQILLRIVGGEVDASGALTFDNANLESWGGIPAPDGTINVTMKGINALIDKAVAMGLIPENDVMGVRMGLAMFTRPGPAPDSLVSEIAFKNNGLFVNGQQLQ